MAKNLYKRRLRISSVNSGSTKGHATAIHDADTGEFIDGVTRIVITLSVNEVNEAEVTYFEVDNKGHIIVDPNDKSNPLMKTETVQNVEIDDITAFEIMNNIRKERA